MRDGWITKAIGEVIVKSGTIDPRKTPNQPFRYVDVSSISNQSFSIVKPSEILGKDAPSRARRHIRSGDVLFATVRPTLRRIAVVPNELDGEVCSTGYFVFRPKQELDGKFLFYHLFTDEFMGAMESLQSGASYPAVNDTQVKQRQISFPPLPEQKRIVAILDEAFEGIEQAVANAEKNLANARELFESSLHEIFLKRDDWEKHTLAELLEMGWITSHLDGNHGGDYPRKSEFIDHGVPYISANCLKDGAVDISLAKFLSHDRASLLRKGIAQNGDVLFAHNATVGPVAMLYTDLDKIILSTSLTYYRCNSDYIIPEYLAHYMRSPEFKRQYQLVMRQSTRNQVPITKQREFFHIIPPIVEQTRIAKHLDELSVETKRLEAAYQQKLAALSELKQSLLQKAFAGELTAEPDIAIKEEAVA